MDTHNRNATTQTTDSPWINAKEAAVRARTSAKRIYSAVAAHQLRAVRLGSRLLFRVEWVDAFLERKATMKDV